MTCKGRFDLHHLVRDTCGVLILLCVAICCSMLQCVAMFCSVLQCVAASRRDCSVLLCITKCILPSRCFHRFLILLARLGRSHCLLQEFRYNCVHSPSFPSFSFPLYVSTVLSFQHPYTYVSVFVWMHAFALFPFIFFLSVSFKSFYFSALQSSLIYIWLMLLLLLCKK